ncbi:Piso0_004928 [Millerozyma farinosa CBS 7064]|uniref:Piso0_004928 protein n=1 Tax=Pichia sorbitophila (strain ATCC MYA-4447 / BCRC 22081 / CBS 7064 / NBRC 10061 / NRRL Y-12695) TaxID=559304 RepID=G8Y3S1_PICSO|nr:Piso0_004928 [Millerozyma farinosa CBS 7064]
MSIVELSKTIDTLAKSINEKNEELERLKRDFDNKLKVINQYIGLFNNKDGEEAEELNNMNSKELTEMITKKIHCNHCNNIIWDVNQESEYILIPRSAVKLIRVDDKTMPQQKFENTASKGVSANLGSSESQFEKPATQSTKTKKKGRSHITCSYCHQQGHVRANCHARLNKPL